MGLKESAGNFLRMLTTIIGLLMLLGIGAAILIPILVDNDRRKGDLQVAEDPSNSQSTMINLRLGQLQPVTGHSVSYIELRAKESGIYASYNGQQLRNLLFIDDSTLETQWLFPTQQQHILQFKQLSLKGWDEEKTLAILYEIITNDHNHDGALNSDDGITIAITLPDRSDYRPLNEVLSTVIDSRISQDQKALLILAQKEQEIMLYRYRLEDFALTEERRLNSINP